MHRFFASRVLIVGAGLGGLTAAIALSRAGLRVEVVEHAASHAPVGAGIVLGVNAVAALSALGVNVNEFGHVVTFARIRDLQGRLIQDLDMRQFGVVLAFARPALHQALAAALPAGVEMRFSESVAALSSSDSGVDVRFDSGRVDRYDLVLGADGLRSRVRSLLGQDMPSRYSGYTCWRTVCADPGLDEVCEYWGNGQRVGLVPLIGGRLYVFLVENAPCREPGPTDAHTLRGRFAPFAAPVQAAFDSMIAEGAPLLHHDLDDLPGLTWGAGRIWLLGDAAHGMLPNQGQGAAMAMEDAIALLVALREAGPDAGHARYVELRQSRVARIHRDSHRIGAVAQWSHPWACLARDRLASLMPDSLAVRQMRSIFEPGLELVKQALG